jgi:predicted membrane metal-binding protein
MSISGLHITMLAAIAGALARLMLRSRLIASSGLLERVPAMSLQWIASALAKPL